MSEEKPLVQVEVTAPIPLDVLKRKFKENIEFVIDYDASKLKGKVLITYLSNLKIKCRLKLTDQTVALALVEEYLNIPVLVDMSDLEDLAMDILLAYTGKPNRIAVDLSDFFVRNKEALDRWVRRLYSIPLYALWSMEQYKPEVEKFPVDEDDTIAGVNFVMLIAHPDFAVFMENVQEDQYTWCPTFFKEYVFQGSNLFNFFADERNPFFVGLLAIQSPEMFNEIAPKVQKAYDDSVALMKGIEYVPSL